MDTVQAAGYVLGVAGLAMVLLGTVEMVYGHTCYCFGPNPWVRLGLAGIALAFLAATSEILGLARWRSW